MHEIGFTQQESALIVLSRLEPMQSRAATQQGRGAKLQGRVITERSRELLDHVNRVQPLRSKMTKIGRLAKRATIDLADVKVCGAVLNPFAMSSSTQG